MRLKKFRFGHCYFHPGNSRQIKNITIFSIRAVVRIFQKVIFRLNIIKGERKLKNKGNAIY